MSQVLNLRADSPNLKTVLVVEDEPALRDLLTKRLKQLECHFVTANDGAEGLQKFEKHRPEIVVTDIVMPKLNGFDMLQKLRTKYKDSFKVIVLTNINSPQDNEMAGSLNVTDYLLKADISLRSIQQKVEALLAD